MRVPGQKFFVPETIYFFAGRARSYIFSNTSLSMRATPDSHDGRFKSKVRRSFVVSMRELCGRLAGVGNALVGTGLIAPGATFSAMPSRRAKPITKLA